MSIQNSKGFLSLAAGIAALIASSAAVQAAPVYYNGTNGNATSNANLGAAQTARNNFIANSSTVGTVTTFTFENYLAPTNVTTTGVTSSQFNLSFSGTGRTDTVNTSPIPNTGNARPQTIGFNTTAGGSNFLTVAQGTSQPTALNFAFIKPVSGFGLYITGLGNGGGPLTVNYNDGVARTASITGTSSGGATYFSFIDSGKLISSISFSQAAVTNSLDRFSIDDITTVVVPEPAQSATLLMGFLGLVAVGVLRKNRRQTLAS